MYILQPQVAQRDKTEALLDIIERSCVCVGFQPARAGLHFPF